MFKSGLVSVTFRQLSPREIVELCVANRLQGIEWGGDVHVAPDNISNAREVGKRTREAGLEVACYGSYYRCDGSDFAPILETALELGAPTIRVWAGKTDAQDANHADFARVLADLERIAALAPQLEIALEFHGGTLTSDAQTAAELVSLASATNLRSLWQPLRRAANRDPQIEANLNDLRLVAPVLSNIHVYEWLETEPGQREAVSLENSAQWPIYLEELRKIGDQRWMLLEFVPTGQPDALPAEATALHQLLENKA